MIDITDIEIELARHLAGGTGVSGRSSLDWLDATVGGANNAKTACLRA